MTADEWVAATPQPVLAGLVKLWHGQERQRRNLPTIPLPADCADPDVVAARAWLAERIDLLAANAGTPGSSASTSVRTRPTLDRHPDGGVLRASVLQRLGR